MKTTKFRNGDTIILPGLVLEQALYAHRERWSEDDIALAEHCGLDEDNVVVEEDYDFDISDWKQRAFLWVVLSEAEARVESLESMITFYGANVDDYVHKDLPVFRQSAEKLDRVLSLCVQGTVNEEVTR